MSGWSAIATGASVSLLLLVACGEDSGTSADAGSGGSGGSTGGTAGAAGGGTTSGGSAGTSTGGAAGGKACPNVAPPTIVTSVAGGVFPKPGGFQGGATPQLDLDAPDPGYTWNDPHVLRVGDEYWMYASATVGFQFPVRLHRLVSNDGQTWHRDPTSVVFDVGPSGSFDAGGVETPAVVFFAGRYHLFYTGYPIKVNDPGYGIAGFRIGHATSCDGVSWTRAAEPVVAPSSTTDGDPGNDWYSTVVGEPGPVVHDGALFLYFTAAGPDATLGKASQVIGLVTTADGITWSAPERALEPDPTLYPAAAGWVGYSTPNAIELDGQVHLFVDVAFDPDGSHWQQIRLHHAVSADGKSGFVQDSAPLASAGDFPWAKDEIRSPDALIDGKTLRLYFAGHELDGTPPDHFAIGMMSSTLVP
jgi:predicted GH43/DUF377 family glycosyl hydrolase